MDFKNKTFLILGGWGLVGRAVAKSLLSFNPRKLVIHSLLESEALEAKKELKKEKEKLSPKARGLKTEIIHEWGNIFVRNEFKDIPWNEVLAQKEKRLRAIHDILDDLHEIDLEDMTLYSIIKRYKPNAIIDCVNSSTFFAYQNIYSLTYKVLNALETKKNIEEEVEKLLCSLYIPQLTRHIQILNSALIDFKTEIYIKVGTSGTGGMGLNIPYTHGETKPSRVLLSKSSIGGAHTLLLFLMSRTPGTSIIKEIKPTAAIAWKKIAYGPITIGGHKIPLQDCPPENAFKLERNLSIKDDRFFSPIEKDGQQQYLCAPYIDSGENGLFSLDEFSTITTLGQMEYVTAEDVAKAVVRELQGESTGHDMVNALNNAAFDPTYRAGFIRQFAINQLRDLEKRYGKGVAFEKLGPPTLSKLLFELYLVTLAYPPNLDKSSPKPDRLSQLKAIINSSPEEIKEKVEKIVLQDQLIRAKMLSIGIPILLSDGKHLLRGSFIKVPKQKFSDTFTITEENINLWADEGWVDLRIENFKKWISRLKGVHQIASQNIRLRSLEFEQLDIDNSSGRNYRDFISPEGELNLGEVVGWIFITEFGGERK